MKVPVHSRLRLTHMPKTYLPQTSSVVRADLERGRRREGNRRVRAVANGRLLTTRLISLGCLSAEIARRTQIYRSTCYPDAFLTPILRRLGRGFCYAYSLNPHEGLTGVLAAERMGSARAAEASAQERSRTVNCPQSILSGSSARPGRWPRPGRPTSRACSCASALHPEGASRRTRQGSVDFLFRSSSRSPRASPRSPLAFARAAPPDVHPLASGSPPPATVDGMVHPVVDRRSR